MCGMNFFMLPLLILDRSNVNVSSMYEALSFGSFSQEFEMQNLALNLLLDACRNQASLKIWL